MHMAAIKPKAAVPAPVKAAAPSAAAPGAAPVPDAVSETGASSPRDMGQVMKASMARVAGRADGKRVSALAQEALRG